MNAIPNSTDNLDLILVQGSQKIAPWLHYFKFYDQRQCLYLPTSFNVLLPWLFLAHSKLGQEFVATNQTLTSGSHKVIKI